MEKEELFCGDSFSAKDGIAKPAGIVTLVSDDGTILFKGHNMIVGTGRQAILRRLFTNVDLPSFRFMFDTDSGNMTTPKTEMPATSTLTGILSISTAAAPYKEYSFTYDATDKIKVVGATDSQIATNEYSVVNSSGMTIKAFSKGDDTKTIASLVPTTMTEGGYIREEPIGNYAYLNAADIRMEMKGTVTVDTGSAVAIYAVGLAFGTSPYTLFSRCVTDKVTVNLNRTLRVYYTLYF